MRWACIGRGTSQDEFILKPDFPTSGWHALVSGWRLRVVSVANLSESLWGELTMGWSPSQLIELLILVGWYHLISFATNEARIELEEWAPRFPQEEGTGEG